MMTDPEAVPIARSVETPSGSQCDSTEDEVLRFLDLRTEGVRKG